MAIYCTNCGSLMNEGAAFCANCGTQAKAPAQPQQANAAPPQSPSPAPPYTGSVPPAPLAPAMGSPILKAIVIALVVIFALGAMGVVGTIYVLHRVKRSVTQAIRERGVDLSDFNGNNQYRGRMPAACSLLTAGEASGILGVTIERTVERGNTCDYYAQPVSGEQRQEQVKKAMDDLQAKAKEHADTSANPGDLNKALRENGVEALTKTIVAGANTGSGPYFTVELSENGKAQIAAVKLAMGVVGAAAGVKTANALTGIGDEAVLGPMDSLLVFTRNGLGVQIDLRQIAGGRTRAIAMAQRMASRI